MSRSRNVYVEPAEVEKTYLGDSNLHWLLESAYLGDGFFQASGQRLDLTMREDDIPTLELLFRTYAGEGSDEVRVALRGLIDTIKTRGPQRLTEQD